MLCPEGKLCPPRRLQWPSQKALADSPALLILESPVTTLSGNDSLNVFMVAKKNVCENTEQKSFSDQRICYSWQLLLEKTCAIFLTCERYKNVQKNRMSGGKVFSNQLFQPSLL